MCGQPSRKHPHERGEDYFSRRMSARCRETPPRAWGRRPIQVLDTLPSRNTPTSVGKTFGRWRGANVPGKHPHERGEDFMESLGASTGSETPPRAWGRLSCPTISNIQPRNTPTSVGKTNCRFNQRGHKRKHPHERGEDRSATSALGGHLETPPRAWGRRWACVHGIKDFGNTPTSVGKTGL